PGAGGGAHAPGRAGAHAGRHQAAGPGRAHPARPLRRGSIVMTSTLGRTEVAAALARAVEHLRGRQHERGWWKGTLATNVTMDAEDLLLREFLGIRTEAETVAAARWIRSQQRAD